MAALPDPKNNTESDKRMRSTLAILIKDPTCRVHVALDCTVEPNEAIVTLTLSRLEMRQLNNIVFSSHEPMPAKATE